MIWLWFALGATALIAIGAIALLIYFAQAFMHMFDRL